MFAGLWGLRAQSFGGLGLQFRMCRVSGFGFRVSGFGFRGIEGAL